MILLKNATYITKIGIISLIIHFLAVFLPGKEEKLKFCVIISELVEQQGQEFR